MAIFMIGIQRSGSNLLRLMLNELPEIAAPHPPHILQRMMPLVPRYGDLRVDRAFALLVDDVCRLVETNPVPWEGVKLDRKDVAARCRARNLVAILTPTNIAVAHAGDLGYVVADFEFRLELVGYGRIIVRGRNLHIFKKVDGVWKIAVEVNIDAATENVR